jgi:hypothetical protein
MARSMMEEERPRLAGVTRGFGGSHGYNLWHVRLGEGTGREGGSTVVMIAIIRTPSSKNASEQHKCLRPCQLAFHSSLHP